MKFSAAPGGEMRTLPTSIRFDERPDGDVCDFGRAGQCERVHDNRGDVHRLQEQFRLISLLFRQVEVFDAWRRRPPREDAENTHAILVDLRPQAVRDRLERVLSGAELPDIGRRAEPLTGIHEHDLARVGDEQWQEQLSQQIWRPDI